MQKLYSPAKLNPLGGNPLAPSYSAVGPSPKSVPRSAVTPKTNGMFSEVPISVYFTIRQYWERRPFATFQGSAHS